MQSPANFTFVPRSFSVVATVWRNEYLSSGPDLGLPRCDINTQLPPSFNIFLRVGIVARIRLASVTLHSLSKGTLKATRIKARLPLKLMSSRVFIVVYCVLLIFVRPPS